MSTELKIQKTNRLKNRLHLNNQKALDETGYSITHVLLFTFLTSCILTIKNGWIFGKLFVWTDCLTASITVFLIAFMAIYKNDSLRGNIKDLDKLPAFYHPAIVITYIIFTIGLVNFRDSWPIDSYHSFSFITQNVHTLEQLITHIMKFIAGNLLSTLFDLVFYFLYIMLSSMTLLVESLSISNSKIWKKFVN